MFPILQIGPLAIQVPGLLLLAGLWIGLSLSERLLLEGKQRMMQPQDISNIALLSLAAGAIGARLGYALRFPSAFSLNPVDLISLSPALLDPWFGLLAGFIAATAYSQRKRLPARLLLDVFTPLMATLTAALFLGNLASGNDYGLPTNLPWAINLFGALRHPAQIYDFVLALLALALLWVRRPDYLLGDGKLFLTFLAITSASRLLLDAFHASSPTVLDGWRVIQIVAWVALAISLILLRQTIKSTNT